MEEKEFVNKLVDIFKNNFLIQREVYSECKKYRIDLVLSINEFYFGVECKRFDSKRGEKIAEYVKQAIKYSEVKFKISEGIFKKIPIFICPALSYNYFILNEKAQSINNELWHKDRHDIYHPHHTMNGFLGALGIGEIRKSYNNTYIFSFSNKTIYSSYNNQVNIKNYNNL